jgi:hypothetical protein
MVWWQFGLLGAGGGVLVEILGITASFMTWQQERRTSGGRIKRNPPPLRDFVDGHSHFWLTLFRGLLGAAASAISASTGQVSGAYMAVATGFAAPSLINQLGSIPQVSRAFDGKGKSSAEDQGSSEDVGSEDSLHASSLHENKGGAE